MDTRVLKYFLTVAQTNNITKAAKQLHVTQPTLSRQIMDLEHELNATLFDRNQRRMQLTRAGVLFQRRATTILQLLDQTEEELHQKGDALTGTVNLGCVVSNASAFLMQLVNQFQQQHPDVFFNLFDGDGDVLRRQIDEAETELACLIEPVEAAKYNYLVLPVHEQWGIILRADDPLAQRKSFTKDDLSKLPLIIPHRNIVRDQVSDILKLDLRKLNAKVSNNLPNNAMELIRSGQYYGLAIGGILNLYHDPSLAFVPFSPTTSTGHVLVWKKNRTLSPAAEAFLQFVADHSN
ncbi:LysR family transcriptional regulator [Limosilactobacillus kribbianus]|uniref:LysR family transcriptional regulator n=1 Tax=Limosilactobacillus kribbianus TaxID=2982695 RepID=UPI0022644A2D